MMEKLEAPQTFLGLKAMIKEVDEDEDGQISFREVCSSWSIQDNLEVSVKIPLIKLGRQCEYIYINT